MIVATSALGIGIDIPDIQLVIYVGRIWSLLDYGQESGHTRRNRDPSQAIMLINSHGWGWGDPPKVDKQVEEYIIGSY